MVKAIDNITSLTLIYFILFPVIWHRIISEQWNCWVTEDVHLNFLKDIFKFPSKDQINFHSLQQGVKHTNIPVLLSD